MRGHSKKPQEWWEVGGNQGSLLSRVAMLPPTILTSPHSKQLVQVKGHAP